MKHEYVNDENGTAMHSRASHHFLEMNAKISSSSKIVETDANAG